MSMIRKGDMGPVHDGGTRFVALPAIREAGERPMAAAVGEGGVR